jgi:hypothetical protein
MKNGMVLINKPEGISSARVVSQVKKIFHVKKPDIPERWILLPPVFCRWL